MRTYPYNDVRYHLECLLKNRNLHYGSGFRQVKTYVLDHGVEDWLSHMKLDGRLPVTSADEDE
jgi:hypothetical protein